MTFAGFEGTEGIESTKRTEGTESTDGVDGNNAGGTDAGGTDAGGTDAGGVDAGGVEGEEVVARVGRVAERQGTKEERDQAARISTAGLPAVLLEPPPPADEEPMPDLQDRLVVIVDAHSLIYQLFHALPPMTSGDGLPVSVVYGFAGDLLELIVSKQPDYLIAAFDKGAVTFRNELYDQYKAHREAMPDELRQQIPLVRQAVDAMGVGIMERAGFEADDLLATVARRVESAGGRCVIVTSDKDCRQLISERTRLYNIRKHRELDAAGLMEEWGIRPDQVVDYQALVGDPVDNVPGVPLIGPKIARQLLQEHGTLENVLDNADSVSGAKRRQNLIEGRERAILSRQLVRLRDDVDAAIPWSRSVRAAANPARVEALFDAFGFRGLKERAREVLGGETSGQTAGDGEPAWETDYRTVDQRSDLQELVAELEGAEAIAIDTETTGTNPRASELVGISLAWGEGRAAYVPIRGPEGSTLIPMSTAIETLREVIESERIAKVGQNLKFDAVVLRSAGVTLRGIVTDTMVADYLLNPGARNHTLDDLARRHLGHTTTPIKDLIGSGKKQLRMDQVAVAIVSDYACEDVDVPLRIAPQIRADLEAAGLDGLYRDVEMPLIDVLAEMEFNGIRVDADYLREMSGTFAAQIESLRGEIIAMAGREFNVDSPKQLAEVLFTDLGLPVVKKTKTGASTDAGVLQQLAIDHPLPAKVLEYRQATKLKNTYIDALPELLCEKTGRIHTSFRQDVAATGRLSSSEPNLQNIPIRSPQGRAIRQAFTAGEPDWLLLGADYSQIELRVLAHYSGDEALVAAYREDADIHTRVAAEVHGVAEENVTSEMRRVAKTINFGIVYGQSPFGLAKTLGIGKEEAREYIERYFRRYPGVDAFMLQTLIDCRRAGYVATMLGRRRDIKGVRDVEKLDANQRRSLTEAERIAINMPIQGSAADLIKLAMLAVHRRLPNSSLRARLLLQIHDELLFEVHRDDAGALADLVRDEMIGVAELKVPLKVDVAVGETWAEA